MKKLKRFLSLCLILALVLGQFPVNLHTAHAAETQQITGVTPVGTTIDLFNYWVDPANHYNIIQNTANKTYVNSGINNGRQLKFWYTGMGEAKKSINIWTDYAGNIFPGIVQKKLGRDNYPVLTAGRNTGLANIDAQPETTTAESLKYLFDDSEFDGKEAYTDVRGLFQVDINGYYSFDSNNTGAQLNTDLTDAENYKSFKLVNFVGSLASGARGFFPFDTLDLDGNGYIGRDDNPVTDIKGDTIDHFFGSHMTTQFVQSENGKTDTGDAVTYDFTGDDDVWIFIDGILVGDVGGIHNQASVHIDFSTGDITYQITDSRDGSVSDDTNNASDLLTRYIDALGEDAVSYFQRSESGQGKVVTDEPVDTPAAANIAKVKNGENIHIFQKINDNGADKWIFADGTYHTLDFFYLERGAGGSNMNLKFNLEEIPPTYIHKVDQDGQGIGGVQFDLYVVKPEESTMTADEENGKLTWTIGQATTRIAKVATGETDSEGMLTLCYSENMGSKQGKMASLADIFNTYQEGNLVDQVVSSGGLKYENALLLELEEVVAGNDALKGYRSPVATSLRLENINGTYILRSNDRWNSGVYATPMAVVSAPKKIQSVDIKLADERVREVFEFDLSNPDYKDAVGLFAVVLAWVGEDTPTARTIQNEANWAPVYGSPEDGWTIEKLDLNQYLDSEGKPDYAKALGAAIGRYAQSHTAEGSFIYSFHASPSGSYNATIDSLPGEIDSYYFMIADSDGNIADANNNGSIDDELAQVKYTTTFYFSKAARPEDMTGEQTYRINHRDSNFQRDFGSTIGVPNIENRLMVQRLDAQGNTVCGAEFSLYAADQVAVAADGAATLNQDAVPYFKDPVTTNNLTQAAGAHVNIMGGAAFHGLEKGVYYLAETKAPAGYAPNSSLVKVIVDDDGVHAYAGAARAGDDNIDANKGIPFGDGDGISVLMGVGKLVQTMANFGSNGHINTTLTDIYALRAIGTETADGTLKWTQVDTTKSDNKLQRKWRVYSTDTTTTAMQYATATGEDILGRNNERESVENPYGYLSSSGWNWDLIAQNYFGIYDPGEHYSTYYETLDDEQKKLIDAEISTKTALPNPDYKEGDDRLDISDGYTAFGNKILNGLFSGSTTVRVASTAVGDLVISKTVLPSLDNSNAKDASIEADNEQFPFSLSFTYDRPAMHYTDKRPATMIGDIDMTPELAGEYAYTVTKDGAQTESGSLVIAADAAGKTYHITSLTPDADAADARLADGKLLLAHGETMTISGLPRGTAYTVTEQAAAGYQQKVEAAAAINANVETLNQTGQNQPTAPEVNNNSLTVVNTISVPGQIDTLAYTNTLNSRDYKYTVNYYEWQKGAATANVLYKAKTAAAQFAKEITGAGEKINIPGYQYVSAVPESITIGEDEAQNVINLYYEYIPDSDGSSGDDGNNDNNTPSDLNTADHTAYVIGYPDGNVRPDGSITRAEAATIFFRLLTDEARAKNWRQTNDYTDVPADMWCSNAISTLSNMGIICGDPDGAFRPNDPITRAELAKISVGFFDTAGKVQSARIYTDVPTGEWYAKYVAAADLLKLVEGYPDKTFRPNNKITRAETCTMVNRILGRAPHADHLLADDAMLTWPDNPQSAWYYTQIQEATNSHDYRWIKVDGNSVDEWTAKLPERSWADLEKQWSDAYDAPGKEVIKD